MTFRNKRMNTKLHRLWKKMLQREIKSVKFVNTWLLFFFVWQSKKVYSLFLSGVINRLLKCCRQSTLITLISKQIYLSILDFIWFFFCYTYCIVNSMHVIGWKRGCSFLKASKFGLMTGICWKVFVTFNFFVKKSLLHT